MPLLHPGQIIAVTTDDESFVVDVDAPDFAQEYPNLAAMIEAAENAPPIVDVDVPEITPVADDGDPEVYIEICCCGDPYCTTGPFETRAY